jgi:hypothetical protein
MNSEVNYSTEHKSEFEEKKIMQDEDPVQKQVPLMKEDFADTTFIHAHKNYLLQPFPRQPGWPALSLAQERLTKNICVNIFKTVE